MVSFLISIYLITNQNKHTRREKNESKRGNDRFRFQNFLCLCLGNGMYFRLTLHRSNCSMCHVVQFDSSFFPTFFSLQLITKIQRFLDLLTHLFQGFVPLATRELFICTFFHRSKGFLCKLDRLFEM